jgi:microcystin-dependent protein
MFGYSSYLDKSMNGIKTITDGVALIQNGNATFNTINVETITSSNLTDCNLTNCTTNDPTAPQSVVNKEYVDDNFVDLTSSESIGGIKTFSSLPLCTISATINNQFVNYFTLTNQGFTTIPKILNNANIWTNQNTFSFAPFCTISSFIGTQLINKNYVDNNFVDKTTAQTITGVKTFSSNCNFNSNILIRTKFKPYEVVYVNTDTTLVLTFPLSQTTIIRPTTAGVTAITIQLPALSANEIGMVFNFVKIVNNLNVTLTASNSIFILNDFINGPTTNTTLLSADKMTTSLAVGFFNTIYYWIEVSSYSTFDRNYNNTIYGRLVTSNTWTNTNIFNSSLLLKNKKILNGYQNLTIDTTLTLSFPFAETSVIRSIVPLQSTVTIVLPTVTVNELGLLFNFFKFQNNLNVIFTSSSRIFTLNDLGGGPTTNTTLLSADKTMTTLMCGFFGSTYYWVEVSNYSTFDRDYNNTIYPRLSATNIFTNSNTFNSLPLSSPIATIDNQLVNFKTLNSQNFTTLSLVQSNANVWTNTNTFNISLPTSTITANSNNQLVNFYTLNNQNFTTLALVQNNNNLWTGSNTFISSLPTSTITPSTPYQFVNFKYVNDTFQPISLMSNYLTTASALSIYQTKSDMVNYVNTSGAQNINGLKTFGTLPECYGTPQLENQLVNKFYVDNLSIHQSVSGIIYNLSIYQTKSDMVNYLTVATANTTYQQKTDMINYLTISSAIFTYQTKSNMINYLLTSTATATYQPISLMTNYLTTATAAILYQLKSDMINYLTTATATTTYQPKTDMVNYVNTSGAQNINGLKTFGTLPECSNGNPLLDNQLVNKFYVDRLPVHQTVSGIIYNLSIYQTKADMTNYYTKTVANSTFIDFTTDQTINATNKRFNGLFCTSLNITPTLGGAGNRQQIYVTGSQLTFNGLWNNNYYRFYCRDSLSNEAIQLEISSASTIINNNLSGQRASFRTPTVNESALALFGTGAVDNRIQFITYSDGGLGYQNIFQNKDCGILFTSEQTIDRGAFCIAPWNSGSAGIRISPANVSIPGPLVIGGEATFNTWVNLKFRTRIYDLNGLGNYTQMYMISGNEFVIAPNANGDKISFYCKDATLGQLNTFISSALGNTSLVNLTCSVSLISNNLTAPTSTIAGTNNLYTNLDPINGFGIVNFGSRGNNINIKCNLNINESVYGTTQNTVVNMEGNSMRFTNNGSTNGNYIFTINESGTYNSLVINKTSVDIAGDANITGSLILYDTTPSTKTISTSLVGNNVIFDPLDTVSTTYQFKTNNSVGVENTPLTISSSGTTLTNITSTNVLYTKDLRWNDAAGGSNIFQIYLSGNNLSFVPLFNNNQYSFQCKDNVPNTTTPLTINSSSTTIQNNLISNAQATFNNDVEINAKVKFRQVKLYNQVKTITSSITLSFPLEEQIVIRPTATTYIELPVITANSLGMSFNFITNSTVYAIWFSTQGTDNIIKNGYTTGNTSTVVLGTNGITSVQMTCLELTAGVYSWSFFSSLPEKVSNPPGTIITMAVQSTPLGYLACDGGSYSFGGIYSNLYQVIGTTYGSSGVGTFKVPNFNNGSFLRGVGGNSGVIATQQQDNIKTHTHNTTFYRFNNGSGGSHTVIGDLSTGSTGSTVVTSATNTAGSPDETRPINYAVHYCIKY